MTYDLSALSHILLTNFLTVRFPRAEPVWSILEQDLEPDLRFRCLGTALRCEELCIRSYRLALRCGLVDADHRRFLDRVEGEPRGGWRIHLFLPNEEAVRLVPSITNGIVGPGDPLAFDAEHFVQWRLSCLENSARLIGRDDWIGDDLP